MKITGPTIKQSWTRALDWLEKQRFHASAELPEAADICDSFDRKARRVPRNICADPSVEAKRALCESLKSGLSVIKKSVLNCLNEADETYIGEYASALKVAANEYLGLQANFAHSSDEVHEQIQVSLMKSDESFGLQIRAKKQKGAKNAACFVYCIDPRYPEVLRPASSDDFEQLFDRVCKSKQN